VFAESNKKGNEVSVAVTNRTVIAKFEFDAHLRVPLLLCPYNMMCIKLSLSHILCCVLFFILDKMYCS